MVIFIKHIDIEGPEILEPVFQSQGFVCKTIDLSLGIQLPKDFSQLEAVVVLGGPMNVYEEDQYPFLREEDVFIKKILKEEIPYLGICLGSQLLAKAAGAKVTKSPIEEIGWYSVQLTEAGANDSLFKGIEESFEVFQWHGDTFAIPRNGRWLVKAEECPYQALKVGSCAYGLQFHMEITDQSISEWSDEYFKNNPTLLHQRKESMLSEYRKKKERFHKTAYTLFSNFAEQIAARKVVH